ncbi:MAG: 2-amino-4-hydroxy-6-hydroxymethyldihydropteridine diphosphokinase [Nitrospirae bacterium]|nr:2-amino-4-hydroxy-6-hydroxymethyldihydropteridine diphosphokinase [Nitrospirota bacterium]
MVSHISYLGIGSNIGKRRENCLEAISLLEESPFISVTKRSSLYETEPVGYEDQPPFINCVIEIETTIDPRRLLRVCQEIEDILGRERDIRWRPRTIDIDILLYNNLIINEQDLRIPHPHMHERGFVLIPLSEIASDAIHPVKKKKIKDLLRAIKDRHSVVKA